MRGRQFLLFFSICFFVQNTYWILHSISILVIMQSRYSSILCYPGKSTSTSKNNSRQSRNNLLLSRIIKLFRRRSIPQLIVLIINVSLVVSWRYSIRAILRRNREARARSGLIDIARQSVPHLDSEFELLSTDFYQKVKYV